MPQATKQTLRRELLAARDAMPEAERKELDRAILAHALRLRCMRDASAILLYVPVGSEIDVTELVRYAWDEGIPVGLPICDRATGKMTFRRFAKGDELTAGEYGIPTPGPEAAIIRPDRRTVCVLPALAYDSELRRIGYGGGYYDRFLETFPGRTVGLAYRKNLLPDVCAEPHDLPVGCVVTEAGTVRPIAPDPHEFADPYEKKRQIDRESDPDSNVTARRDLRDPRTPAGRDSHDQNEATHDPRDTSDPRDISQTITHDPRDPRETRRAGEQISRPEIPDS